MGGLTLACLWEAMGPNAPSLEMFLNLARVLMGPLTIFQNFLAFDRLLKFGSILWKILHTLLPTSTKDRRRNWSFFTPANNTSYAMDN